MAPFEGAAPESTLSPSPMPQPSYSRSPAALVDEARSHFGASPSRALALAREARELGLEEKGLLRAMKLEVQALRLCERSDEAFGLVAPMLEFAKGLGFEAYGDALATVANLELGAGHYVDAEQTLNKALKNEVHYGNAPGLLAGLLASRGSILRRRCEHASAFRDYSRAATLFAEAGEPEYIPATLNNKAVVQCDMGDFDGALATYLEARELLATDGDAVHLLKVRFNVAVMHSELDNPSLALEELGQIIPVYRDDNDVRGLAQALVLEAACALDVGDRQLALTSSDSAMRALKEVDTPISEANTFSSLSEVLRKLSNFSAAHECLARIDYRAGEGQLLEDLSVRLQHRVLMVSEGEYRGITEELEDFLKEANDLGSSHIAVRVMALGVEVHTAQGQFEEALGWSKRHAVAEKNVRRHRAQGELRSIQIGHELARSREQQSIDEAIRKGLEQRVRERTSELLAVNRELAQEVADREKVERERHELEMGLQQVQQVESLGRLAGGVAHDFNNILMVIQGNASLLELELTDPALAERVAEILEATEHGGALMRSLLASSRYSNHDLQVISPDETVRRTLKMAGRLLGNGIQIELNLGAPEANVEIDCVQLESVLLNLAINASDAMDKDGKLLLNSSVPEGSDRYLLVMTDTGHGIPAGDQSKVFEPFYTTKPAGKGTGLGLSTAHVTMQRFGGSIRVQKSTSAGTQMAIELPVHAPTVLMTGDTES